MLSTEQRALQSQIIADLNVAQNFDAEAELEARVNFLADYLMNSGLQAFVLGISGGVDSLVGGCLAQRAAQLVRDRGRSATFVAMRLPYGKQQDEHDAQEALKAIRPDMTITVDIRPAADAMMLAVNDARIEFRDEGHQDFLLGNIKARQRMIAQYAAAGAHAGLVVGTDHAAEALMGFFTKFGDGAADIMPLSGLNKRRVRALASLMGAPHSLVYKIPTADLETLAPMRPDEQAFGVTYDEIDDFLESKEISSQAFETICQTWRKSAHKRALPVAPER